MTAADRTPILLARASERLRQERETFEQQRRHEDRWFALRLVMGYASVALLASVMCVSSYILFNSQTFPQAVVTSAGAALFVDVLGLLVGVWRIALNPRFMTKLRPVTDVDLQELSEAEISGGSPPQTAPES